MHDHVPRRCLPGSPEAARLLTREVPTQRHAHVTCAACCPQLGPLPPAEACGLQRPQLMGGLGAGRPATASLPLPLALCLPPSLPLAPLLLALAPPLPWPAQPRWPYRTACVCRAGNVLPGSQQVFWGRAYDVLPSGHREVGHLLRELHLLCDSGARLLQAHVPSREGWGSPSWGSWGAGPGTDR